MKSSSQPAVLHVGGENFSWGHIDLGADQRVRNRIEEVMDRDVIVEIDARRHGQFTKAATCPTLRAQHPLCERRQLWGANPCRIAPPRPF
jgi:hypothetical protein